MWLNIHTKSHNFLLQKRRLELKFGIKRIRNKDQKIGDEFVFSNFVVNGTNRQKTPIFISHFLFEYVASNVCVSIDQRQKHQ